MCVCVCVCHRQAAIILCLSPGLPEGLDRGTTLSSNRYYPPHLVDATERLLHRLLAMLHPRPFIIARFAPHGAWGCVRAVNDEYIDVVLR